MDLPVCKKLITSILKARTQYKMVWSDNPSGISSIKLTVRHQFMKVLFECKVVWTVHTDNQWLHPKHVKLWSVCAVQSRDFCTHLGYFTSLDAKVFPVGLRMSVKLRDAKARRNWINLVTWLLSLLLSFFVVVVVVVGGGGGGGGGRLKDQVLPVQDRESHNHISWKCP